MRLLLDLWCDGAETKRITAAVWVISDSLYRPASLTHSIFFFFTSVPDESTQQLVLTLRACDQIRT
jgi:hypothetical protein